MLFDLSIKIQIVAYIAKRKHIHKISYKTSESRKNSPFFCSLKLGILPSKFYTKFTYQHQEKVLFNSYIAHSLTLMELFILTLVSWKI